MNDTQDNFSHAMKSIFSCEAHTRLHSKSLDKDLSWYEKIAYWLHYLRCLFCRRHDKQLTAIDKAAHHHHHAGPSAELPQSIKDSISQKLKEESDHL